MELKPTILKVDTGLITVLIVPYGIETPLTSSSVSLSLSVNCTLWN